MTTTMKVKPDSRAACVEQIAGIHTELGEMLKRVGELIDPATDHSTDNLTPVQAIGAAAQQMIEVFKGLAALQVSLRWKIALDHALEDEAAPKPMADVLKELSGFLLGNACLMTRIATQPYLFNYHSDVIEQAANSVGTLQTMLAVYEKEQTMCAEHGLNFDAIEAGDEAERAKLNGIMMQDVLKDRPQGVQVQAAPGTTATQVAAQYGLASHQVEEIAPGVFQVGGPPAYEPPVPSFKPRPRSPDTEDDGIRA